MDVRTRRVWHACFMRVVRHAALLAPSKPSPLPKDNLRGNDAFYA